MKTVEFDSSSLGVTRIGPSLFEWKSRTYVMGIINTTPDSFSGDGVDGDLDVALKRALTFQECGADIVDVGGESTRPPDVYVGSTPVSEEEELSRVIPVIEKLVTRLSIPISIDTYKSRVANEAIEAGASMINDVWGFKRDPDMMQLAADRKVPVILMHNQDHLLYDDLVLDVINMMSRMRDDAVIAGIAAENIILDPGLGFGKTAQHNLEIMRRLDEFDVLGQPILVGISRKSTIGDVLDLPVHERMEGTAAAVALSISKGADIVRVHDVKEMARVTRMSDAIVRGWNNT